MHTLSTARQLKLKLVELPLEDTVDVFTAARMARVSCETVRRWCDERRIPCCKLVGRWRIFRTEFLTWIDSHKFPPQNPQTPQAS